MERTALPVIGSTTKDKLADPSEEDCSEKVGEDAAGDGGHAEPVRGGLSGRVCGRVRLILCGVARYAGTGFSGELCIRCIWRYAGSGGGVRT